MTIASRNTDIGRLQVLPKKHELRINEHMEDLAAKRIKTEEDSILDFKADEARMLELLERHDETCSGCQVK